MSRLSLFVTAIAAALDDPTVAFEAGKLRLHELKQKRRIIFTRYAGRVNVQGSPGRAQLLGVPVSGATPFAMQAFTRRELVTVTIRAEHEEELDLLFDAFLSALFLVAGPNVTATEYEWAGGDSTEAGHWSARQPAIRLLITVQLRAIPTATGSSIDIESAIFSTTGLPLFELFGAIQLPMFQLSGTIRLRQSFAGSLILPELALAGSIQRHPSFSGALSLPELTLAGSIQRHPSFEGAISLPELTLAGTIEPWSPDQSTAVSEWLLNNATSGAIAQVNSQITSNHATQATSTRRAAGAALRAMTFVNTSPSDSLVWALSALNANTARMGFAFRFSPVSIATNASLIAIRANTGGASAGMFEIRQTASSLRVDLLIDGTNGRSCNTATSQITTGQNTIVVFFDKDQATEANRLKIWINGTLKTLTFSNIGSGGSTSAGLTAGVTGNIIIGNGADSNAGSNPLNGTMAHSIIALDAEPDATDRGLIESYLALA